MYTAAMGVALVAELPTPQPARAEACYVATAAARLRADSLRTARPLRTLAAGDELTPLGPHTDFAGMYHVMTARGDRGWVAAEHLVEWTATPAHHTPLSVLRRSSTCPKPVSRGAVKDLTDKDVGAIIRTPQPTTIAQLRALPAPAQRPEKSRANRVEETVFRVTGRVTRWGLEADQDFHLVLAAATDTNSTIVLEIPSPSCIAGAPADLRALVNQARASTLAALGPPPIGVHRLPVPKSVTVEGVGFFDFGHSIGHPPNAFELHPLLKIHFS